MNSSHNLFLFLIFFILFSLFITSYADTKCVCSEIRPDGSTYTFTNVTFSSNHSTYTTYNSGAASQKGSQNDGSGSAINNNHGASQSSSQGSAQSSTNQNNQGASHGSSHGSAQGSTNLNSQGASQSSSQGSTQGNTTQNSQGASQSSNQGSVKGSTNQNSQGASQSSNKGSAQHISQGSSNQNSQGASQSSNQGSAQHSSQGSTDHNSQGASHSSNQGSAQHSSQGGTNQNSQGASHSSSQGSAQHSSQGSINQNSQGVSQSSNQGSVQHSSQGSTDHNSQGVSQSSSHGSAQHSSQGSTDHNSQGASQSSSQGSAQHSSQGSTNQNSQGASQNNSQGSAQHSSQGGTSQNNQGASQNSNQGSVQGNVQGSASLSSQGSSSSQGSVHGSVEGSASLNSQGSVSSGGQGSASLSNQGSVSSGGQGSASLSNQGSVSSGQGSTQTSPGGTVTQVDIKGSFSKVYAFGDSFTDKGNAAVVGGEGSASADFKLTTQGHLIIDFLCKELGLPPLPSFKNTSTPTPAHGMNFAIAGATALPSDYIKQFAKAASSFLSGSHISFSLQIDWFNNFISQIGCKEKDNCQAEFEGALFWLGGMGIDDHARTLGSPYSLQWLKDKSVLHIASLLTELLDNGAKYIVVQGLPPLGCLTMEVSNCPLNSLNHLGCSIVANTATMIHNQILQKTVETFRRQYPEAQIVYADIWNAYLTILQNPAKYNFQEKFKACCGTGGNYNFNIQSLCGLPGTQTCSDPSKYINWDGIHFTEAMNLQVTNLLINQGFCQPSFAELVKKKTGK